MPPYQPFASVWSQGGGRDQLLKTPEPLAEGDTQPPNAPRPRFRIKRRNVSNLNAPTEQFLASVAAADEPIPSIEEPRVLDQDMADSMSQFDDIEDISYVEDLPQRIFSPPKTPAPGAEYSLSPKQFPNWSLESASTSLESSPESSRPSTAHSTHTSASLFSTFSINSDDLSHCISPDTLQEDRFPDLLSVEDADKTIRAQPDTTSKRKSRKGPWTKPMSQHLWSTYTIYLQDPKVTPFRLSKGGIPPPGVCTRVAREAKRSWKGSKSPSDADHISESVTPTGQNPSTFVQWPHSHATTRAHLLELCRMNARTAVRNHQYLAHSPTPFGKHSTGLYNRFSGQDMTMSLVVSTAESMQPYGPLAQLTSSQPEHRADELPPPRIDDVPAAPGLEPLESERTQLASPFVARSYGPSASNSVPSSFAPTWELQRRQVHTDGPRRLRSPFRLTEGRSTQKRRSGQPLVEPRRIKRPSLGSDLWIDPSTHNDISTTRSQIPDLELSPVQDREPLFAPRTNIQELFEAPAQPETPRKPRPAPMVDPPRLGSPFALTRSSLSFPNRLYNVPGVDIGTVRRPFATVQQSANNNTPSRSSLVSRLAYLDERLREFRCRDQSRRRSESPL